MKKCTYPGCTHTSQTETRHLHGLAEVEMRKITEFRGSYYNPIIPDNNKKRVKAGG